MKTVILIDNYWRGHHATYFKQITRVLLEMGCIVWAFCPEPEDLKNSISEKVENKDLLRLHIWNMPSIMTWSNQDSLIGRIRRFSDAVLYWVLSAKLVNQEIKKKGITPDLIFFPKIDGLLKPLLHRKIIDFIFPFKWSGIYVNPSKINARRSFWLINSLFFRPEISISSKNCVGIATIDETYIDSFKESLPTPIYYFPDVTDETRPSLEYPTYKEIKARAENRVIVGVAGILNLNKSIDILYECIKKLSSSRFYFFFAGEPSSEMLEIQKKAKFENRENIFFYLEKIPDGIAFNSIFNACDIAFLVYRNANWSSNVLTKAAMLRKKVLANSNGLIGMRVNKYKMGYTVDGDGVQSYVEMLEKIVSEKKNNTETHFEAYFHLNSLNYMKKIFAKLLDIPQNSA